jgi:hypothetical protein
MPLLTPLCQYTVPLTKDQHYAAISPASAVRAHLRLTRRHLPTALLGFLRIYVVLLHRRVNALLTLSTANPRQISQFASIVPISYTSASHVVGRFAVILRLVEICHASLSLVRLLVPSI